MKAQVYQGQINKKHGTEFNMPVIYSDFARGRLICWAMNMAWVTLILKRIWRSEDGSLLLDWIFVGVLWVGAIGYEHSRQYNGSLITESGHSLSVW